MLRLLATAIASSVMRPIRALACLLLLAGTGLKAEAPKVTCSFSIPADWARTLVEDGADVRSLAGPNTELHAFQPSPADVRKLTDADLIIGIDPGLEPWLDQLVKSNKLNDKVLWLGYTWVSGAGKGPCPCHDPNHIHTGEASDPHVWMDAALVQQMVNTLADRLGRLKGLSDENRALLEQRRIAYLEAIRQVDAEATGLFNAIPKEKRLIVTHHGNLGRFAKRYGIELAGVVLQSPTTEAADPSARDLARLAEIVRTRNVRVLVSDRGQRAPAAFALARETGLQPPLELNIDSLDHPGAPAEDWIGMLRWNARRLAWAMTER